MIDAIIDGFLTFTPVFNSYLLLCAFFMHRIINSKSLLMQIFMKSAIIAIIIILVPFFVLSIVNHWNCSIVLFALLSSNVLSLIYTFRIKLS